jgi:ATP-dependent DNA helicase RecG
MKENQRLEWKESWRDEYLRWICGFANAEGGKLVIGMDDRGVVKGVAQAQRLIEELPNKIRDILGVMADVRLVEKKGKALVEVKVAAYPSPISYRGEYYYRSGGTNQLLKGSALDRFLLRKYGHTWDGMPVPRVAAKDLAKDAIDGFRVLAKQSRRLEAGALRGSTGALLEKLGLTENSYLKRAALLLFHPEPDRHFVGAYVKIGYFQTASELLYHDEIHGDLFSQTRKTMELLTTKYLKAAISYQGIQRIESLPVPEPALREAILNAIIHRVYSVCSPIQIRVYPDKLAIWNPGELPEGWTMKKLFGHHSSKPYNPLVANAFFRAGEIEAWGRGIERILDACRDEGAPEPRLDFDSRDVWVEFPFPSKYLAIVPVASKARDGGRPESRSESGRKTPVKTPVETSVQTPVETSVQNSIDSSTEKPNTASVQTSVKASVQTSVKTSVQTSVKILNLLREDPGISMAQVAAKLRRSVRAVEMAAAKLVKAGHIRFVGPKKNGHWEVLK